MQFPVKQFEAIENREQFTVKTEEDLLLSKMELGSDLIKWAKEQKQKGLIAEDEFDKKHRVPGRAWRTCQEYMQLSSNKAIVRGYIAEIKKENSALSAQRRPGLKGALKKIRETKETSNGKPTELTDWDVYLDMIEEAAIKCNEARVAVYKLQEVVHAKGHDVYIPEMIEFHTAIRGLTKVIKPVTYQADNHRLQVVK